MKLKTFLITALCLIGLLTPSAVSAATFSVRLGQPKSPTNQNDIKLTYVALDSDNREITVKCFKKGPSDSGYSQFDVAKTMIPGGNTDHCRATSSVISAKGTYSFYITGEIGSEVITSSVVTLDYNTDGPGTPSDYSKEKINNCDYKIKFKTSNDNGKTIKVQLFRSDTFNVSVDNNNIITTKFIGSNTNGEIINSAPDCNKNYYYVLRAVDSSDNVSGTVGDNFTTTSYTNSTNTTTGSTTGGSEGSTQPENQALLVVEGSQVTNGEEATTQDEQVEEGSEITISPEPSPEVLGSSTDKNNFLKWSIVAAMVITGYFLIFRKKKVI